MSNHPMTIQQPRSSRATTTRHTALAAAVLSLSLIMSAPAYAKTWRINLRDAGFVSFVTEVADITGKNFVVDPRINGNVTVISNKALTSDEVYNLFLGVLSVNGVVAIPSGNTIKLVPDVTAKQTGVPFSKLGNKNGNEQVVTRLINIDNNNPTDLIAAVRPLMSQSAHMATLPGSKSLIVSDRSGNIDQLEALIKALDSTSSDEYEFIQLKETAPNELIDMIEQTLSSGNAPTAAGASAKASLSVVADNRNNRLIVKGDKRSRQKIVQLVKQLDVPAASFVGGSKMFKLKYAEAKDMVSMLQAWVSNGTPPASSTGSSSSSSTGAYGSGTSSLGGSSLSAASNSNSSKGNASNDANIFANESLNTVIVRANPTMIREIEGAIKQLDVRRPQVLIQAAIVEITGDNAEQLGVQWAMGNPNTGVGAINFSNAGSSLTTLASNYVGLAAGGVAAATSVPSIAGAVIGFGKRKVNDSGQSSFYGAVLQALETNSKSNLLSAPYVTTLDNKEATLLVGQNVPFITGSSASTNTTNPYTTIERKDVGINLKVKPRIGADGMITMEVEQEVSSVQAKTSNIASADLITNKRKITTTVQVQNEHIATLGGLMQDDASETGSAVPGLSHIPFLGRLFKATSSSAVKRNLLVFIQPTILDSSEDSDYMTAKNYQQLRLLQLQLNPKGDLAKLPVDINDVMRTVQGKQ